MNFVLFLLLNVVLLVRPEEFFRQIEGARLYLLVISLCTLASIPRLLEVLSIESLKNRPVAVCVLIFYFSCVVSLCVRGRITEAFLGFGPNFAKMILYYFLLLSVVDTQERFHRFIITLVILISLLTAIAIAQMSGAVNFPNITPCMQTDTDKETGETIIIPRMVSSGIFNDPNDLCLLLGLGILSCIYCATTSRSGLVGRLPWIIPIPLFAYGLLQTHSRGGLLGVMSGGGAYLFSRFGGAKAIPFVAVGVLGVLAAIGGGRGISPVVEPRTSVS